MSTSYTAEEFLARLSSGEEPAPGALTLTGMAQAVDGATDSIEFAVGTRCTTWTSVPLAVVERVEVHDTVTCRGQPLPRVTLTFRPPSSPEAAAYAGLLAAAATAGTGGRRVVRKPGGGEGEVRGYGLCDFNDYEIDADGQLWVLVSVEQQDGACIGTYEKG
jgi:hypothetical protein